MLNKTRTGALLVAQENTLLSINFCFYEETTPIKKIRLEKSGNPVWFTKLVDQIYSNFNTYQKKKGKEGGMCNKKHINL